MNKQHMEKGDAALRMALRGLRHDIEPGYDLWPGIAARLQPLPQQCAQSAPMSRPVWLWPVALAASLLLAVGVAWQIKPLSATMDVVQEFAQVSPATTTNVANRETLVQQEAESMTVHYESALRELERLPIPAGWQPGLDALDDSAIEIRTAMQHDPTSRLLLERLRATYTRRLVLARRALYA